MSETIHSKRSAVLKYALGNGYLHGPFGVSLKPLGRAFRYAPPDATIVDSAEVLWKRFEVDVRPGDEVVLIAHGAPGHITGDYDGQVVTIGKAQIPEIFAPLKLIRPARVKLDACEVAKRPPNGGTSFAEELSAYLEDIPVIASPFNTLIGGLGYFLSFRNGRRQPR